MQDTSTVLMVLISRNGHHSKQQEKYTQTSEERRRTKNVSSSKFVIKRLASLFVLAENPWNNSKLSLNGPLSVINNLRYVK